MTDDENFMMREPCRWCLSDDGERVVIGTLATVNGQDSVRCRRCQRHCYNAPRSETGKQQRNVKSRPDLEFGQRERILQRDNGRCVLCGRDPIRHGVVLHIAHALSVADGRRVGVEDDLLFGDANLFTACEECNLGIGKLSIDPRLWLHLAWNQIRSKP